MHTVFSVSGEQAFKNGLYSNRLIILPDVHCIMHYFNAGSFIPCRSKFAVIYL